MLYDIMYKIPYRVFHFLYVELFKKLESDDGKKEIAAKKSAEQIEEAMSRWQQKTFLKNTMEKK